MKYTIEELFQSVTDIYAQYDEGEIELTSANEILEKCCRAFVKNLEEGKHE
jgi:hypothetical protein